VTAPSPWLSTAKPRFASPGWLLALEDPAAPPELDALAAGGAALPQPLLVDGLPPELDLQATVLPLGVAALAALGHGPLLLLDGTAHRAMLPRL
jgi:hypothetical protein